MVAVRSEEGARRERRCANISPRSRMFMQGPARDSRRGDGLRGAALRSARGVRSCLPALTPTLGKAPPLSPRLCCARRSPRGDGPATRSSLAMGFRGSFVDPALAFLAARGAAIRFGERLREIRFDGGRAVALDFESGAADAWRRRGSGDRRAALDRSGTASRPETPDDFRASSTPISSRAAPWPAGHSRRRQRTDRMAVRLSRSPLGHDQQRRPAHRPSAR